LLLKQHQIPSSSSFLKFDEKFRKWLKLKKLEFNSRLSFMEDESTVLYTEIPFEICISQVKKIYLFKNRVEFRIYWCKSPFGLIVYFWVCIDAENSGFITKWLPFTSLTIVKNNSSYRRCFFICFTFISTICLLLKFFYLFSFPISFCNYWSNNSITNFVSFSF
jgi:hypothetical protein